MSRFLNSKSLFVCGLLLYSLNSYLILLRDAFLLERFSLTLGNPQIETLGLQLANFLKVNYSSTLLLTLSIVVLTYSYINIIRSAENTKKFDWRLLLITILVVFGSFPSLSTDIFDYTNFNRVAYLHQANPWIYAADNFSQDQDIWYGSWTNRASVYPPVNFLASSLVNLVFGHEIVYSIIGFKTLNLGIYLAIIYFLVKSVQIKTENLVIFAFNPLILIEFIGNGHNDLLMGLFVLLSLFWLSKSKYSNSAIAMGLAVLSKISVLIIVPFISLALLLEKKYKIAFGWGVLVLLIIGLGILLMGESGRYLLVNLNDQLGIYQKSLATVIRDVGNTNNINKLGPNSDSLAKFTTFGLFVISSVIIFRKFKRNISDLAVMIIIAYLMLYSPMLQPWYLGWYLVLVSLVKSKPLKSFAIIFSLSALFSYPVYYVSLYLNPTIFWWQAVMYLVMIVPPLWFAYRKILVIKS